MVVCILLRACSLYQADVDVLLVCRSRTPDSEGNESSFHYDVHKLPSHDEYSYHNHYVSQTSPDVSAEETWKATGTPLPCFVSVA